VNCTGIAREELMVGIRKSRLYLFAGVAAISLLAASAADAAELALKRVLLSTAGVGLYEYEAEVEGDATVELKVRLDQVDDVLKSLVVFDDHGGVGGLDLASAEPLSEAFRPLPFTEADLQSTPQLLNALRGVEVEVGGPRVLSGRIINVVEETGAPSKRNALPPRHRVAVMSDKGIEQFVLEEAESVKFADASVQDAVARALKLVAANHERDSRTLRLISKGSEKRALRVAYLAAAPVWKTSYRLVLDPAPDAKQGALQGWATLENLSGQDWQGVDLTLVSGRPVAYKQALYRAYMVDRPDAPVDLGGALTPGVDQGGVALDSARLPMQKAARTFGALESPRALALPPAAALSMASAIPGTLATGAEAITAQQGVTQVSFHIPHPVSVDNGRTLSLPIVDSQEPVQRVALYDPQTDRRHPLSAAELVNDGKAALPPGIVTIYENGAGGASYVGDSRLSATQAGEKRLLSFALDLKTTIEEDASENTSLARARSAKGVLTIDDLLRRRAVFHVNANEPRRLIVAVPKLEGGKLTEPKASDVTESEGRYRATFDVKAGDGQNFAVTQERTQTRLVALSSLDDASLALYVRSGEVDAQTRAALNRLGVLREVQADAERAIEAVQAKIDAVVADQARLKDLLGAVVASSDLQKRYLKKLDADETELEGLRSEHAAREKARDDAAKAVEAFLAGL
jgi:hypothetical protein